MKKLDLKSKTDDGFILEMLNIVKEFPGVKALKSVDFKLKRGEAHGLVGENGAGKSTLMKILIGVYTKNSGKIIINKKEIDIRTADDAHKYGIGMVFQELSMVPQLTVAQNIFLGIEFKRKFPIFVNENLINKKARELIDKFGIDLDPKSLVGNLSAGFSHIVEILKVLAQKADIIIMDEPTASLTRIEEDILFKIIGNLKKNMVSIIYISHRLQEIFETCDRVSVLRDGLKIGTKNISDINIEKLVEMMTGKIIEEVHRHGNVINKKSKVRTVLEVKEIVKKPRVNNVSFTLKSGEILGVTGLMGSGKTEIAKALFGIDPIVNGEIRIDGNRINIMNPQDAINIGIHLVPEDKRIEGLVLSQAVETNLTLPILNILSKAGFVRISESRKRAVEQVSRLSIKTPSLMQETAFLSGGNQQKVVIGKWLMEKPVILLLDEPTVGIDIKSKVELRNIIADLVVSKQCSVILFTSELNEVILLADRIIVLYEGRVFKEFSNSPPIDEIILHRAVQGIN